MTEICILKEQILTIADGKKVTIVGIDGMGGAGKSTLSDVLKQHLSATHHVIIFHLDDFITPKCIRYNDTLPEWECYYTLQWRYDYFLKEIIQKLFDPALELLEAELYDKDTDTYYLERYELADPMIVIIEGVFLQREELQGICDYTIYMDIPEELRLKRVLGRDTYIGSQTQIQEKYVKRYFPAENYYIETCKPLQKADYIYRKRNSDCQAVVFDMDGIIFDSERLKLKNWIQLAKKEHIPDIETTFRKCIGKNQEGNRQVFLETYGDAVDFAAFKEKADKLYREASDHGKLPQKPGIKELLSALKGKGLRIGVASSTREALVRQQLFEGGLAEYFDIIIGGDNVTKGKPDPEIYLKACQALHTAPRQAVAVEDSISGVHSAYQAGMDVIMVPDLLDPTDEILRLPVHIKKDHFQVIEYFKKIL